MKTFRNIIILIFIGLFFFGNAAFAEKLKLLSLNMGAKGRTAALIADMIDESGADIVFLQEVWVKPPENAALNRMVGRLGKDWAFVTSSSYALMEMQYKGEETYKTGGYAQNNAILYNRKKLSVTDFADVLGFTDFDGEYLFDKNNVQVVAFKLAGTSSTSYDLYAINVHLPYNDYQHRMRDLETLEKLYAKYKRSAALVIAGDFNLNRSVLTARNFDFVDGSKRWFSDPNYGIATTVSPSNKDYAIFVNDYDHFIYNKKAKIAEEMHRAFSEDKASEASGFYDARKRSSDIIRFGKNVYTRGVDYREAVSDHIPIMLAVEVE